MVLEVGPGAGFGELALLYDSPRAASVIGAQAGSCWRLDRTTFKQVIVGMTRRRREQNLGFVNEIDLFHSLSDGERSAAADAMLTVDVRAGDVVLREGEASAGAGARFFIVERGELAAEKEGGQGTAACPPLLRGSYFGELGVLVGTSRSATVRAVTDARLLAMDRATMLRLLPHGESAVKEALAHRVEVYRGYDEGVGEGALGAEGGVEAEAEAGLAEASLEAGRGER